MLLTKNQLKYGLVYSFSAIYIVLVLSGNGPFIKRVEDLSIIKLMLLSMPFILGYLIVYQVSNYSVKIFSEKEKQDYKNQYIEHYPRQACIKYAIVGSILLLISIIELIWNIVPFKMELNGVTFFPGAYVSLMCSFFGTLLWLFVLYDPVEDRLNLKNLKKSIQNNN